MANSRWAIPGIIGFKFSLHVLTWPARFEGMEPIFMNQSIWPLTKVIGCTLLINLIIKSRCSTNTGSLLRRSEQEKKENILDIINRKFTVEVLRFANGNFVTISEGESKIGATIASIATGPVPASITVVPAKSESLFLKIISERLSSITKGINIVSAFIPEKLDNNTAKTLINKIKEIVEK